MNYDKQKLRTYQLNCVETLKNFDHLAQKYSLEFFAINGTLLGAVREKGFISWDDDLDLAMIEKEFNRLYALFQKNSELGKEYGIRFDFEVNQQGLATWVIIYSLKDNSSLNIQSLQRYRSFIITKFLKYLDVILFWNIIEPLDFCGISSDTYHMPKSWFPLYMKDRKWKGYFRILFRIFIPSVHRIIRKILKLLVHKDGSYIAFHSSLRYDYFKTKRYSYLFPLKKVVFEDTQINIPNDYDKILTQDYDKNYMIPLPVSKRIPTHTYLWN